MIPLGAPKGYGATIAFGITTGGVVLALAATSIPDGAQAAYLAVPGSSGYRWTKLPFNPLDGACRTLIGSNGDIAGGTPSIPCAIWQRLPNGTYSQPVRLAPSPRYQIGGISSLWTSGSRFVVGGVQQQAGKPQSAPPFASIWSPEPSPNKTSPNAIVSLGGTPSRLFAVGLDSKTAAYWPVRFATSGEAHLGALHELALPAPGPWKNVYGRGITVDSSGNMVAVGYGTQGSPKSPSQALIWRGTHPSRLQSVLPKGSGWSLSAAFAVNSQGEIIGTGAFKGQASFFLLKPPAGPG